MPELLESLLKQSIQDFKLIVRDDGSTDGTLGVLNAYQGRFNSMNYIEGRNIGARNSFFELMRICKAEPNSLILLCDQDDIWHAEKIEQAVNVLVKQSDLKLALYFSRSQPFKNNQIMSPIPPRKLFISQGNALIENLAIGHTMCFTGDFLSLIRQHPTPAYAIMHDWWLYLIALFLGQAIYDPHAFVKYRIHDRNTVGIRQKGIASLAKAVQLIRSGQTWVKLSLQANEFRQHYGGQMSRTSRQLLKQTARPSLSLLWHLISLKIRRQSLLDQAYFIVSLLPFLRRG